MDKARSPKWLEELQQKSWEPEILLSGIVLYGMFQAPDLLDKFLVFAKVNIVGATTDLDNLVAILKIAFYWLTLGLILHLISRGVWVGMVGLSFTFPEGIDYEKLRLAPKYQRLFGKIPSMQQIVINLEKVCSSLFSISFMLFMSIIGAYLYFLVTIIGPILTYIFVFSDSVWSDGEQAFLSTYAVTFLVIGCIGLLDFLTLGFLKRFKWLSKIYYPVYVLISTLTLARIYRPIYYTMVSNFGRWKIAVFLIIFVVASLFGLQKTADATWRGDGFTLIDMWSDTSGTSAFSGYYDDQNDEVYSIRAQIQSDVISENVLRLFVVLRSDIEDSIKKHCEYDSLIKLDTAKRFVDLYCLDSFYQVKIDDSLLTDLQWKFHYKQKNSQRGILTYLDISDLGKGLHEVAVKGPDEMYSWNFALIPFYREINALTVPRTSPVREEESDSYLKLKPLLPK